MSGWFPEERCYLRGLALALCYWQGGHSAVNVARLVLVKVEVNFIEHMHNLHACHHGVFFMSPLNRGGWKRGYNPEVTSM